ncbi:hypothetical protein ACFO0A_14555 [Novosphingobium tardum]|uniref:ABM domain-containing protein n=1 Tax=Novosphingobium tardum TaxID=1538021 RepID=A0ABV8RU94_9SPHN
MTIYMQSTLELRAGDTAKFEEVMKDLVATVEGVGWHLVTAIMQISGRLHTAIDVWSMPDLESYQRGLGALRGHERFPEMARVLAETIERETIVLGVEAPWVPQR